MKDSIILALTAGRAGSYFFQSLFDSHPQLICFPPIYTSALLGQIIRKKLNISSAEKAFEALDRFHNGAMLGAELEQKSAPARLLELCNFNMPKSFDYTEYKRHFLEIYKLIESESSGDYLLLLFKSMCYAYDSVLSNPNKVSINTHKTIFFQFHTNDYILINWFAKRFDKIYLPTMLRSPLVGLNSSFSFKLKAQAAKLATITPHSLTAFLRLQLYCGNRIPGENIHHFGIKLESLHKAPELTLQAICQRLCLDYSESVLDSTISGVKWTNFQGKETKSSFMPEYINENTKIDDFIPELDANILGSMMIDKFQSWDYLKNFEYIPNHAELSKNHYLLTEYLPHVSTYDQALNAYKNQTPIIRHHDLQFFLAYGDSAYTTNIEVI